MTHEEYLALPLDERMAILRRTVAGEFFNDSERAVVLAACDTVDALRALLTAIAREFDTWDDSDAQGYSDLIALALSWRSRIAAAGLAEGRE